MTSISPYGEQGITQLAQKSKGDVLVKHKLKISVASESLDNFLKK